jgi:hypothetical protein
MKEINLLDWDCDFREFCTWVHTRDADVSAVASSSHALLYRFNSKSDFLAFTLAFSKDIKVSRDFFDNGSEESNYF